MAFLILSLLLLSANALMLQKQSSSGDAREEPRNIPTRGKVAVVIRGEPFRDNAKIPCSSGCRNAQLNASESVITQLIKPLEDVWKNTVDVFNVACGEAPCNMTSDEDRVLSSSSARKVRSTYVNSGASGGAQAVCVQGALDFLESDSGDAAQYDLIMLIRHDVEWLDSFSSWSGADFAGFNFFSQCQKDAFGEAHPDYYPCVNDILHVFPGRFFKAWRAEVGTDDCFNETRNNGFGHTCWKQTATAAGGAEHVHLATPWIPPRVVRDANSWLRFTSCDDRDAHS
eukprot:TRINITY_DN54775_c0_g1_i1.p1 TRINITY_DN54775_c0_g1~~TRINITY_DN54775_c0_g1_i1.p1  ORF type:complete len:303 (+),score=43.36 TRINITY_DN54775_c0_g1_i1:57-911(+)